MTNQKCLPRFALAGGTKPSLFSYTGPLADFNLIDDLERLSDETGQPLIAIPHARVSSPDQVRRGNLKNQIEWLERELDRRGISWVRGVSGQETAKQLTHRPTLRKAVDIFHETSTQNPDAIVTVVGVSVDRFLRHRFCGIHQEWSHKPSPLLSSQFARMFPGVIFATVLHPDTPFREVYQHAEDIGLAASTKPNGRPPLTPAGSKKQFRLDNLSAYRELKEQGKLRREIARILDAPESTLRGWDRMPV